MDKFIITGVCEACGELLGKLKPSSALLGGFPTMPVYLEDPVRYHVSPIFTKARVKCDKPD